MGRWVTGWDPDRSIWLNVWIDETPRLYRGTAETKVTNDRCVLDAQGRPIRKAKRIGFQKEDD